MKDTTPPLTRACCSSTRGGAVGAGDAGLALRERVEQVRHVQPAIGGEHRVQAGCIQLDLGERPCPPEQARELEIDEEAIEAEQGPPVGLLEAERA